MVSARKDVNFFGSMYIGLQQRDGDPEVFWSHENQIHPPSISENGKI